VTLLRGRREGLELAFAGRELREALDELEARLTERPSFYRGAAAVANFGAGLPEPEDLGRLRAVLAEAGIELRALRGRHVELEAIAQREGLGFEAPPPGEELAQRRALRGDGDGETTLSDAARSLVADFAGARGDIAQRRRRGEASVPRLPESPRKRSVPPPLHAVEAGPTTLYHAATLRGGQVLHHTGNIVVVGDVNPGAELVATGDILVFGRLAGIAHAGAGGDENARIYALEMAATQLRIAAFIGAEEGGVRRGRLKPEAAIAQGGRIVVLSLERLGDVAQAGAPTA
jgi:septum site-determining protein MinC